MGLAAIKGVASAPELEAFGAASCEAAVTAPAPETMQLPETRPPVQASADLLLLAAVSLWGLNYSIVKFGLGEIAPLAFPVFRFGVGGVALLVVLRLREGSVGVRRRDLPLLCLVGFLGVTLSQISFVFALTNTSATDTAFLGATAPIVTAVLAAIVGLETSGRRYWISVLQGLWASCSLSWVELRGPSSDPIS